MDPRPYIRILLRKWFPEPKPRPIALQSSILKRLPPELIHCICDFLPDDSAASFSLSCTPFYQLLGKRCLEPLRVDDDERFWFLLLLEKDLPGHIVCEHCTKLHAIKNAIYHHPSKRPYVRYASYASNSRHPALRDKTRNWLQCWMEDGHELTYSWLHPDFSSTIFRMAMKTHRLGQDCSELLKLLSCKPYLRYSSQQYTGTARIVEGRMLWRDQQVDMVRGLREDVWMETKFNVTLYICPHLNFKTLKSWLKFKGTSQDLQRCNYCYMDFRIDFKSFEGCEARFITKWKDFGEGYSADDEKWWSHFSGYSSAPEMDFEAGSIFEAFQRDDDEEFDFLSLLHPRNKK